MTYAISAIRIGNYDSPSISPHSNNNVNIPCSRLVLLVGFICVENGGRRILFYQTRRHLLASGKTTTALWKF